METSVIDRPECRQTAADAQSAVTLHRSGRVRFHAEPEFSVRDCNVISLSESGCRIALREFYAQSLSIGDLVTLNTSIPPGLNLKARLAAKPEIVPDWGCILILSFCRIDEQTYRHLISFIRNLSADERARHGRRQFERDRRARKRALRRKFILSGSVVMAFLLAIVLFQVVTWLHTSGWQHARDAAHSISVLGKAATMTDEERLQMLQTKAQNGSLREILQSLTPQDKQMLGKLLGGSGLLTPERLEKLLSNQGASSGASRRSSVFVSAPTAFAGSGGFSAGSAGGSDLPADASDSSAVSAVNPTASTQTNGKSGAHVFRADASGTSGDSRQAFQSQASELLQLVLAGNGDGAVSDNSRAAALTSLSKAVAGLSSEQKEAIAKTLGTDALTTITASALSAQASTGSDSALTATPAAVSPAVQTATDYLTGGTAGSSASSASSTNGAVYASASSSSSSNSATSATTVVTPTATAVTVSASGPFGLTADEYASLSSGKVPDSMSASNTSADQLRARIALMMAQLTSAQKEKLYSGLSSSQRALLDEWYTP